MQFVAEGGKIVERADAELWPWAAKLIRRTEVAAAMEAAKSARGGWSALTLASWGVPWPPPKGWKDRLLAEGPARRTRRNWRPLFSLAAARRSAQRDAIAAEIDATKSARGGWTRETLELWGVPWPPRRGWRRGLIDDLLRDPGGTRQRKKHRVAMRGA